MKKTILRTFAVSIISMSLLISCASKQPQEAVVADSYDSDEGAVKLETNTTQKTKKKTNNKNAYALPNNKNALESFFTFGNKDDIVIFDQSSVFTEKIGSGIKQQTSNIILNAKDTRQCGFGSAYMAAYYIFLIDSDNKEKITNAYNSYLSDFENKRLNRKDKKSLKAYGEITANYKWGSISMSTPNHGTGKAQLGYEFYKGSPYFVISNYPIKNDYYDVVQDATSPESMRLKFYFTKAQIKDFLEKVSDDKINAVIRSYYPESFEEMGKDDVYTDDSEVLEVTEQE